MLKQAVMHGALANVLSMPLIQFCSKLDEKLPTRLLERILLDPAVQNAISSAQAVMPERLQWPLLKLQGFSEHLKKCIKRQPEVLLEDCDAILRNFEEYSVMILPMHVEAHQDVDIATEPANNKGNKNKSGLRLAWLLQARRST